MPESPVWSGSALEPTNRRLAADGITINEETSAQLWRGERLDPGWAMSVLWRPSSTPAEDPGGDHCADRSEGLGTSMDRNLASDVVEDPDVPAGTPDP